MKTPKNHYLVVAAAAIALGAIIPASLGDESQSTEKSPIITSAKVDPVLVSLDRQLMEPLKQQAKRWGRISRRKPTAETSYQLVEVDKKPQQGIREFQILQISTPFNKKQKPESREYLKVRHLSANDTVLVALKNDWVPMEEHPILKHLPKPKPGSGADQKITP